MTPIAALHSLHAVNPCHAPVVPLLTCEEVCPDRTNAGVRVEGRGRAGQEVGGPITRPVRLNHCGRSSRTTSRRTRRSDRDRGGHGGEGWRRGAVVLGEVPCGPGARCGRSGGAA